MNGPTRLIATALVLAALATAMPPAMAGQAPGPPAQGAGRAARIPVELSDVLVHSPLTAACTGAGSVAAAPKHLRIATWNIHAARSAPVSAIAAELQAMQADVIALQEVDVRTRRSGFIDEPAGLASALGFNYVFAASIKWDEGDYGLAVLSRWPLMDVRRHRLAAETGEPRIALEVTVCAGGRPLHMFNHHADVRGASRDAGFEELRAILHPVVGQGMILLGDFNEQADQPGVRGLVADGFVDLGADRNVSTTDGGRFDYLLADRLLAPLTSTARVWPTNKSDHHAVLADLEW